MLALVLEVPPLHRYELPPEAVSVTLPQPVKLPETVGVGIALTEKVLVLLAIMLLVHPLTPPDCSWDIVMEFEPMLFNTLVLKLTEPAVETVTDTV